MFGHARAFLTKTGTHAARGIGWFYMVTTCAIQMLMLKYAKEQMDFGTGVP